MEANANAAGRAAMILSFDIEPAVQAEHDEWHSHEHLPERLAIAGFERGSRWTALAGSPRYWVMYEVRTLAVLDSPAYLERLNHPSPWTQRMMPAYRGMQRGLCRVLATAGRGLGGWGLLLRFGAAAGQGGALRDWLGREILPALPQRAGLVGAQLFETALQARPTAEQRLRGTDAAPDIAVFVTGYEPAALAALAAGDLAASALAQRGATGWSSQVYQLAHVLTAGEIARGSAAA